MVLNPTKDGNKEETMKTIDGGKPMKKVALLWDKTTGEYFGAIVAPNPYPYSPALIWSDPQIVKEIPGTRTNAGLPARVRAVRAAEKLGLDFLD